MNPPKYPTARSVLHSRALYSRALSLPYPVIRLPPVRPETVPIGAEFRRLRRSGSAGDIGEPTRRSPSWRGLARTDDSAVSADQVVELAVLDSPDERRDLRRGVDQRRTAWVAGITDGDRPTRQFGHLHATPVRVAVVALAPTDPSQPAGWNPVVGLSHRPSRLLSPLDGCSPGPAHLRPDTPPPGGRRPPSTSERCVV